MDYSTESELEPEPPTSLEVSDGSLDKAYLDNPLQGIFGGARRILPPPATDIAEEVPPVSSFHPIC